MGIINLSTEEKDALVSIDQGELSKMVDQATDERRTGPLSGFRLSSCGPYVREQHRKFERAVLAFAQAKSSRKIEETGEAARRAGYDLISAVRQMLLRMKAESEEDELFHIDDSIFPPISAHSHINVRINYRWRKTRDGDWQRGTIVFTHTVVPLSRYELSQTTRKPSAAKQREDHEAECYMTWERIRDGALYSLRDYFREGRDGSAIPAEFKVKTDQQGILNNYSTRFWQDTP